MSRKKKLDNHAGLRYIRTMSYTERNRRIETRTGPASNFTDTLGNPVYVGPTFAVTESVSERSCDECGYVSTVRGVLGPIRWMAEGCPNCGAE